MAELDALLAQCRNRAPFADGEVSDTSNRSDRDWPWWSVEVVQRRIDGNDTRRATAVVSLSSTIDGRPGDYDASWRGEVWRDSSVDQIDRRGSWRLHWSLPTADELSTTVTDLLDAAWRSIDG